MQSPTRSGRAVFARLAPACVGLALCTLSTLSTLSLVSAAAVAAPAAASSRIDPAAPAATDCRPAVAADLDWSSALQRLLDCNREIALARRRIALTRADVLIAGQRPNPTLSLGGESISPSAGIGAGGPLDKQIDYTARLDQTFERGGKRQYRVEAAEQASRAATWTVADTVRQTELALARAWIDLWGAQERAMLHEELAGLYQRTVDGAQRRLKAGDVSAADLARIELESRHAAAERASAEGRLAEARNVVAALLALDGRGRDLRARDPWPASVSEAGAMGAGAGAAGAGAGMKAASGTTDASVAGLPGREDPAAEGLRPDLLAARADAAAAAARGRLARSQQTRDVTVGVQSERYARPAGNGWSFGLFASVPLFIHHNSEGEIARAEAERAQAELGARNLERQALADRQRLLEARAAARIRRERVERDALPLAQRVAGNADLGYRKGAGTVLELLDALRQLRTLQLDALEARLDEDRADAEVRAGMLLPDSDRDPVFGDVLRGLAER